MKPHLVLALTLLAFQPLHADWVIVQKTATGAKDKPMTIKIKDNMVRNDIGDDMTVLINGKDGMVQAYMHAQKTFMSIDPASLKGISAMAGKFLGGEDGQQAKPKATGEKVKVGDWDTEVYTWQSKIGSGKFYVAYKFPNFAALNVAMDKITKGMGNPMAGMFPSNADFPGMVVKSEMSMMGKTTSTELVSAKEQPLSDADFKGPEGYTEMKIPSFPGAGKTPKH